jgi:hypothetical protein
MAGVPPLRCFNCNYDHGRFRDSLTKLQSHIKMNPDDRDLWTMALDEFRMCMYCRSQFVTAYQEFDSHLAHTNGNIGAKYADVLHHRDLKPNGGLVDIVRTYTNHNKSASVKHPTSVKKDVLK